MVPIFSELQTEDAAVKNDSIKAHRLEISREYYDKRFELRKAWLAMGYYVAALK